MPAPWRRRVNHRSTPIKRFAEPLGVAPDGEVQQLWREGIEESDPIAGRLRASNQRGVDAFLQDRPEFARLISWRDFVLVASIFGRFGLRNPDGSRAIYALCGLVRHSCRPRAAESEEVVRCASPEFSGRVRDVMKVEFAIASCVFKPNAAGSASAHQPLALTAVRIALSRLVRGPSSIGRRPPARRRSPGALPRERSEVSWHRAGMPFSRLPKAFAS